MTETGFGGARFDSSIPHGLFPSVQAYEFEAPAIMYLAYTAAAGSGAASALLPFMPYAAARSLCALAKMRFQAQVAHPYLHAQKQSMFPWPIDVIDDFNCHITQHHKDGTCLGVVDVLPLNSLYTYLMRVHGMLYSSGFVHRGTLMHEVVNVVSDYILMSIMFVLFWCFFKIVVLFGVGKQSNMSASRAATGATKKNKVM